jgi:nitrogen fixation/metabolism regulation signal transduction histidine kinase
MMHVSVDRKFRTFFSGLLLLLIVVNLYLSRKLSMRLLDEQLHTFQQSTKDARIELPVASIERAVAIHDAILVCAAIVTTFLAVLVLNIIVRHSVLRPIAQMTAVCDAISRGDFNRRVDIHTGDEWESLSQAFNRMLRYQQRNGESG